LVDFSRESYRNMTTEVTMSQGQQVVIRPPTFLRVPERATEVVRALTLYANVPSVRSAHWRKARCVHERPSALQQVMGWVVELNNYGVRIADLRRIPQALTDLIDDLSTGVAHPTLTWEALAREVTLEAAENAATLAIFKERTPATLKAFADAARAEALYQLELARAADREARQMVRGNN